MPTLSLPLPAFIRRLRRRLACALLGGLLVGAAGAAPPPIRLAFIDPLSGHMGEIGQHALREFEFAAARLNAAGGVQGTPLEIVPMDDRLSRQEALAQLERALALGIRYVLNGTSSEITLALLETIERHNARHPERAALLLNFGAVGPELTNERCSFWHFRFDADADMKLAALVHAIAGEPVVRKVYLINEDYSFGRGVARGARALLAAQRPDVRVVGDDLHPVGRIKDFAPYVARIKAAGADTVITGNWGNDMARLIKATRAAGLRVRFYTFYSGLAGTPLAMGEAGVDRVHKVSYYGQPGAPQALAYIADYKRRYGASDDPYTLSAPTILDMLARAMREAGSHEPLRVARALEDMRFEGFFGEVRMRAADHQLLQPLFLTTFARLDGRTVRFNADGVTEFGFREDLRIEPAATALPTRCRMARPRH